ncbi:MAG: hypothetical protein ACRYG7_27840 [Janthinobacterium lividum]
MTRQIILAYGRETEHRRAVFAVLSFWAWYEGDRSAVQTVLFTDRPEYFAPYFTGLPVEYKLLTPASLALMRGEQDYVHRIKLCIINQIAQEHSTDALFFCDSDTFFVAPAAPLLNALRPGISVMHQREQTFTEAVETWASFSPPQDEYPRRFIEFIKSRSFEVSPGDSHHFQPSQFMWNSGVLGLAAETTALTPAVLALNDTLYAGSGWILTEQIAFSLALQTCTELQPSNQYVFHYWAKRQKEVMDKILDNLPAVLPPSDSLDKRLARARKQTKSWRRAVQSDEAQQVAKLAFSRGELLSGVKYTVKSFLASAL